MQRQYDFDDRCRERCTNQDPYGWPQAKWNTDLQAEFVVYRDWRIRGYVAQRPKRLHERAVNMFEKTGPLFEVATSAIW